MKYHPRLFTPQYIIGAFLVTILPMLFLSRPVDPFMGFLVVLPYLIFCSSVLGAWILPSEHNIWRMLFGAIGLCSLFSIILSAVYWFFRIDIWVIQTVLALIPLTIGFLPKQNDNAHERMAKLITMEKGEISESGVPLMLLRLAAIGGDILLFATLLSRRYGDTLISPWTILGPKFFLMFFLTSVLLFFVFQKTPKNRINHAPQGYMVNLPFLVLHATLMLSVALILFKNGFGFDPFIHHAAEEWILAHGVILPKQPYYIGQYMLAILISALFHLPIASVDAGLVPIFAGILFPAMAFFAFVQKQYAAKLLPALLLMFFIPLNFFTATTPNNLALLYAALCIFWMWYETEYGTIQTHIFGLLLAGAALAVHPFIGVPLVIAYLGFLAIQAQRSKPLGVAIAVAVFLCMVFALPALFFVNAERSGDALALQSPIATIGQFLTLFKRPFWEWIDKAPIPPLQWKMLYWYKSAIKPIAVLAAIAGFFLLQKKYKEQRAWYFLLCAGALFVSSFLLATTIKFPNVITYEQGVYADRLLEFSLIFLVPFFLIATNELFKKIEAQKRSVPLISMLFAAILLISWYFTYPTRDP
ncbi:MAG: hypothetical protein AAB932_01450, partial [Patescibacteria group bacterium]